MKTKLISGNSYKLVYKQLDFVTYEYKYSFYDLNNIEEKPLYGWTRYNQEIPFVFKNQIKNENNEICYEFYSLEFNKTILVYKAHFHPIKNKILKL